jgi:hypothetical protein
MASGKAPIENLQLLNIESSPTNKVSKVHKAYTRVFQRMKPVPRRSREFSSFREGVVPISELQHNDALQCNSLEKSAAGSQQQ